MLRLLGFSLMLSVFCRANGTLPTPGPSKFLNISVSRHNQVFMGRDTLQVSELPKEIKNRLWKSYLGTGKMYDAVELQMDGELPEESKKGVLKAITEGLQMALKDICLEKHKQYFENLNSKQQDKIRKQFPILFQADFSPRPAARE